MRDVELDRRVLGLESSRATILFTPKVPICADRTLSFLRKDRDEALTPFGKSGYSQLFGSIRVSQRHLA